MGKRSLWKGPFICNKIISDLKNNNSLNTVKTTSRSTTVLPFLIGKTVKLHNGKFYSHKFDFAHLKYFFQLYYDTPKMLE